MLNSLTLRNFRAFRNQRFEFRKINVFVGPNNSGKSSAISAINLLAQTVKGADYQQSPLVLNGQFDQLGTYFDLVHGGRANTPIGMDIGIGSSEVRLEYKYRSQRREIEITRYEQLEDAKQTFLYGSRKDSFELKFMGKAFEDIVPGVRKRRPRFHGISPLSILYAPALYSAMRETRDINGEHSELLRKADRTLRNFRMRVQSLFDDFDSLSPFRDRPQRTYLYTGETAQTIGTTGSNTAMILSSDESRRGSEGLDLVAQVSRWFKVTGIAEEVRVKSLTSRHYEIVVVDVHGNEHNICDVGFGCSQVLPVLAATLNLFSQSSRSNPLLVVQEPEIHLHPNAQAALGSFFAGLVPRNGQIFIETHSDNLVLRLARHVADGTLSADDLRIFYVCKVDGQSTVQSLMVDEDGIFKPKWPGGFFPQRQSESLALARAQYTRIHEAEGNQLEFSYPEERE